MENPVIIFGAKGNGALALEIFESNKIIVYGFLDDDESLHGTDIGGVPILGSTDDESFLKIIGKKCEAFVAVDEVKLRSSIVEMIEEERKVMPANAIHQTAYISNTAAIHHGTLFAAKVVVGPFANIGNHCQINTGVIIESNATLSDFVQVGAGSVIGANVTIGPKTFIGPGVTIVAGVKIGKNARIGAGSVVIEDIPNSTTVFGNPAKKV